MTKEETIEKIKRQITIGECEKNIGIPVYISDLKTILSMLEEQDKIIDLMASEILKLDIKRANNTYDKARIWETEKGIKQYFENKVKESE